jgi:hypothetical protein
VHYNAFTFTLTVALVLGVTGCSSDPMSAKEACAKFDGVINASSASGNSSSDDSKQVAGQLEDLSDKAPDSLRERITKTAQALRDHASSEEATQGNATVRSLGAISVDMYISEFRDVCQTR